MLQNPEGAPDETRTEEEKWNEQSVKGSRCGEDRSELCAGCGSVREKPVGDSKKDVWLGERLDGAGKIFAMFARGKFVAKLPKERADEIVNVGKGERFDPGHGRLMKEWVALKTQREPWLALAQEAFEFVKTTKSRQ